MRILKMLAKIHKRCSTPKRFLWKKVIAKMGVKLSLAMVKLIIRLVALLHVRPDMNRVRKLASSLTENARDQSEIIERLCRFVNKEIAYFPLDRWLPPGAVLRYGIGDCKNQAALLQGLLSEKGVNAEVVVGLVGWKEPTPRVHAWVNVCANGASLICDPTLCGRSMSKEEYASMHNGFVDVSEEYKLKNAAMHLSRPSADDSCSKGGVQ